MGSKYSQNKVKEQEPEQSKLNNQNNHLKNIKSDYFIQKFFGFMHERKTLEMIKCNKNIQKRINININNYIEFSEKYSSIELEIIPMKNNYGQFINIEEQNKKYYHIYFNDDNEEIKSTSINDNDKVSKINIIIEYQVKLFSFLFFNCKCIESIHFKKFFRNNITNMIGMFYKCISLKELNLNNFNTINVTDMSGMFCECSSLKELNLNNFNTINVTNMRAMFSGCTSLKELNLDNFNTIKVTDMYAMFRECSDEIKLKIKNKFKNFREEAFFD